MNNSHGRASSPELKIGILTYTSNFNIGTFMQAYAGLRAVREVFDGALVEIVNLHSLAKHQHVGYDRCNLKRQHINPMRLVRHLRRQRNYKRCQDEFLGIDLSKGLFTDSYSEAMGYVQEQSYDLLFVGSDTVLNFYDWNLSSNEPPAYWLSPELSATTAMLAASVGTSLDLHGLTDATREQLSSSAHGFQYLGVRDTMTRDFIVGIDTELAEKIQIIPDPTFSLEVDVAPAERYLEKRGISPEVPLIGLDLPSNVPGLCEAVTQYKKRGFRVVSWRGAPRAADYDFSDMTPLEWAGMFAHFRMTLTNRFHASVFSLKNLTPVIGIDCKSDRVTESGASKLSALFDDFGIRETQYANVASLVDQHWLGEAMARLECQNNSDSHTSVLEVKAEKFKAYLEEVHQFFDTQSSRYHADNEASITDSARRGVD